MITSVLSKSPEAKVAINRVKNAVKKEVYSYEYLPKETVKELQQKKQYMQSDEFLKDTHNEAMFGLIDNLMAVRDKIAALVKENNENSKEKLVQARNGFSRIAKYLDKNPKLHSADYAGLTKADHEYVIAGMKVRNKSKQAKLSLDRSINFDKRH